MTAWAAPTWNGALTASSRPWISAWCYSALPRWTKLGAFDLLASLVGLAGGGVSEPLGIKSLLGVDLDDQGFAAAELVIGEGETGGAGLQPGEDQHQRFLQGIGPGGIGAGKLDEPFGLLLPDRHGQVGLHRRASR